MSSKNEDRLNSKKKIIQNPENHYRNTGSTLQKQIRQPNLKKSRKKIERSSAYQYANPEARTDLRSPCE
jgi:hypothetical protein